MVEGVYRGIQLHKVCKVQMWHRLVCNCERAAGKMKSPERRNHVYYMRPIPYCAEIDPVEVKILYGRKTC